WDWRETSKLVIPVENPSGDPVTVLLRIEDEAGQSLSGKVAGAPKGEGKIELLIDAPLPRPLGRTAGRHSPRPGWRRVRCRRPRPKARSTPRASHWYGSGLPGRSPRGRSSSARYEWSQRAKATGRSIATSSTASGNSIGSKRSLRPRCCVRGAPKKHNG